MSDKRRRRKQNSDESEQSDSEAEEPKNGLDDLDVDKDEGVDSAHDQEDSEYESADDDIEIIDEILQNENGGGEEPYPGVERQEGDGEETPSSPTTLDDDEDKKNPAYIPKRGMFYEHDDRIDPEDEEEEEEEEKKEDKEKEKDKKGKKVWKADASEKWGHDKFMEMEQTPKNQDELVAAYGYDIRNEDTAPRARRRRRYGRGPNKYTRSWKDEDAYVKPATGPATAKPVPEKKPGGKTGKSVKIEDSRPLLEDESREPLKREKSMTEMKSNMRPELKREKSAPEMRMNKLNRNSRERDDDSFRNNRRSDGFFSKGNDFGGGRGFRGGNRGGGRGGGRGHDDHFRGGGRGGRGGYDDRHDRGRGGGGDRRRDDRGYQGDRDRYNDDYPAIRGSSRGRGGRGRGRNDGDRVDKRHMDQGNHKDLGDNMKNMSIKDNDNVNDKRERGGMRYSQQRRGGSEHSSSSANPSLQEMYAEGIDPALCSGPPSAPPFQNQMQQSNNRLSNQSQSNWQGQRGGGGGSSQGAPILNYGGAGYAGVPVSSLNMVPAVTSGLPLTAIPTQLAATITTGVQPGMPMMAAPTDPMMIGPDGFTEMRGGVTYFNPTAQNFLPQRQVTKRAKAPIAIVDPSQKIDPAADYNNRSLPSESNISSESNPELTAAQ